MKINVKKYNFIIILVLLCPLVIMSLFAVAVTQYSVKYDLVHSIVKSATPGEYDKQKIKVYNKDSDTQKVYWGEGSIVTKDELNSAFCKTEKGLKLFGLEDNKYLTATCYIEILPDIIPEKPYYVYVSQFLQGQFSQETKDELATYKDSPQQWNQYFGVLQYKFGPENDPMFDEKNKDLDWKSSEQVVNEKKQIIRSLSQTQKTNYKGKDYKEIELFRMMEKSDTSDEDKNDIHAHLQELLQKDRITYKLKIRYVPYINDSIRHIADKVNLNSVIPIHVACDISPTASK
ncbi:hypothetical protein [Candidatus Phytoplasma fraxini]|uniref:Uncharacterized protein n=1 Tax=Ash yellows phytoplasma TaxID=35780 RepID=A0ABZ2U9C3_ASHYP